MFDIIHEMFSFAFIWKALIVGTLVALCASLLGVTLVLKRFSMIGDGLSHVGFGALSLAMVMNLTPMKVAVPIVIIAAFFLLRISENGKMKGDAAIALISSSSIAIGVILTSLSKGMNMDLYSYMFGSILALSTEDVYLSVVLSITVLILFILCYHRIFALTFDENFSKATGMKTDWYKMMLAILTAITIVVGMRIMGTMLISSLIIFPALTSMRIFQSYRKVVISSAIVSVTCFLIGITGSYIWNVPAGASIVVSNLILFLVFSLIAKVRIA